MTMRVAVMVVMTRADIVVRVGSEQEKFSKVRKESIVGKERHFWIYFKGFIGSFGADKWFAGPVVFVYRGHQSEE